MSEQNNGGKSHIYTTQSLGEKGLRAQSAVSIAAGSLETFENDEKNKDHSSQNNKNRKKRKKKARRPEQDRNPSHDRPPVPRRKPVNSKNTLEERLAYYKEKYGEEFKAVEIAEATAE